MIGLTTMLKKLTVPQQLWVDALRSGEYKQTSDTLQNGRGYCCLGVACVVAQKNGITVLVDVDNHRVLGDNLSDQTDVMSWLGLRQCNGAIVYSSTALAVLNDRGGLTFSELADVIEWNADRLFKE